MLHVAVIVSGLDPHPVVPASPTGAKMGVEAVCSDGGAAALALLYRPHRVCWHRTNAKCPFLAAAKSDTPGGLTYAFQCICFLCQAAVAQLGYLCLDVLLHRRQLLLQSLHVQGGGGVQHTFASPFSTHSQQVVLMWRACGDMVVQEQPAGS